MRIALATVCAALLAGAAVALPPVVFEKHVVLTIDVLQVEGDDTKNLGAPIEIEIGPDAPSEAKVRIPWAPAPLEAALAVSGTLLGPPEDGVASVRCTATVRLPGREPSRTARDLEAEGTALFDVLDDGGRRLVLAVRGERVDRPVVQRAAKVGDPVRFLVAIERIDGDRAVLLETNHLNTFVGQSVGYSFRRGADAALESVRLDLLPVSVSGTTVTIQAQISGALPGTDGSTLLSRNERIIASRQATSTLSATAGTPPSGYRFQVTPDF